MMAVNHPLTPQELAERMKAMSESSNDTEKVHKKMDALICKQLKRMGFGEGVAIFAYAYKWYL
jgi:hypothetical protein